MKKILSIACILVLFILTACDLKLFSTINLSDIFSSEHKTVMADVKVYVTSCSEDEINKIQAEFNKRNIVGHYNKCTRDNNSWNNYALFSIPLKIVKNNNQPVKNLSDIYIQYSDNKFLLRTSERLENLLKSDSEFSRKIHISAVEFALVNDTDYDVTIKPFLVFVDEKAVLSKEIKIAPYQKTHIKLSDVANKLLNNSNVEYQVFEFINTSSQLDSRLGTVIELN